MKLVSILGDSVSTFQGTNPRGYSVFYDTSMQRVNGLNSVSDTWWDRVITSMNARLCVNNSYSGSILIYAGFNDFAGGAELISSLDTYGFEDSYDQMLRTIRQNYPSARTVCATLMRTRVRGDHNWQFPEYWAGIGLEDYNNVIRWTAQENRCDLADLARSSVRYETLDGAHPTAQGHREIAVNWIKCMADLRIL